MPKISVIVPVYQVERYLDRCVESVLGQSFSDYECILVDDGSKDASGAMCDAYAAREEKITVIHKENGGLSSARNAALEIARGDYICFLDSDDALHPQILERMYDAAVRTGADMVSCGLREFSSDSPDFSGEESGEPVILEQKDYIDNLYPRNFGRIGVTACGKLYRREIFSSLRFPEGKIYEDLHVYLDVLRSCEKIAVLEQGLYCYYTNPQSITRSNYLAHDRFGEFRVREGYIGFFKERGLHEQARLAQNDYLTFFMRNYFAVMLRYPQRKEALKAETAIYKTHLKDILSNPYVCRMRKVCGALMLISPRLLYPVAKRCIPDCLIEEMR